MKLPFTWAETAKCEPDSQCLDRDYKKEMGKRQRGEAESREQDNMLTRCFPGSLSTCPREFLLSCHVHKEGLYSFFLKMPGK